MMKYSVLFFLLVWLPDISSSYRLHTNTATRRQLGGGGGPVYLECLAENGSVVQVLGNDGHAVDGAIEFLFFLFSGLVIGSIVLSIHTSVFERIPYLVKVLVLGVILGILDLVVFDRRLGFVASIDPQILKFAFIPILAFSDAMKLDSHVFTHVFWQTVLLAVPGVIVVVFVMAVFARYALPFDWSWNSCLLFGSALGATDPVTMASVLINHSGLSSHMTVILQSEAHVGSIISLLLFELFVFINRGGKDDFTEASSHGQTAKATSNTTEEATEVTTEQIVIKLVELSGYGILVGCLVGVIGFWWLKANSQTTSNRAIIIQFVVTILMAYSGFVISEGIFHANGLATVFITALFVAVKGWRVFAAVKTMANVWNFFQYVGNTVVFLASGLIIVEVGYDVLSVEPRELSAKILYLFVSYACITSLRILYIFLVYPAVSRMGYGLSRSNAVLLSASGVRGTISLILAIFILGELDNNDADSVTIQIIGVVILTILINGSLAHPLASWLGLLRRSKVKQTLLKYVERRFTNTAREAFDMVMKSELFEDANEPVIKRHVTSLSMASTSSREYLRTRRKRLYAIRKLLSRWKGKKLQHEDPTDKHNRRGANSTRNLFEGLENQQDVEESEVPNSGSPRGSMDSGSLLSVSIARPKKEDETMVAEVRELLLSALRSTYWDDIQEGIVPRGSGIASMLLSSVENGVDNSGLGLIDFDRLFLERLEGERSPKGLSWNHWHHLLHHVPGLRWLGKKTHRERLGMSVYAVSCFIDAHERARQLLNEYIGGAGMYRDYQALARAPEVQRVLNESIEEEREAKAYLEAVRTRHPGLVRAAESRKVISLVLYQQKQFADELKRKGLLDSSTHHSLMLQIRHDMNRMRHLTMPGDPKELEEILIDLEENVVEADPDDADHFDMDQQGEEHRRPSFSSGAILRSDSIDASQIFGRRSGAATSSYLNSRHSGYRGSSFGSVDGPSWFEMRSRLSSRLSKDLDLELMQFAADETMPLECVSTRGKFALPQPELQPRQPSTRFRRSSTASGSLQDTILEETESPIESKKSRNRSSSDAFLSGILLAQKNQEPKNGNVSRILQHDKGTESDGARRLAILRLLQDAQEKRELARMSILYRKLGKMYLVAGEYADALESIRLSLHYANRYGEAKAYALMGRTFVAQAEALTDSGPEPTYPTDIAALYRQALQAVRQARNLVMGTTASRDENSATQEQLNKFSAKLEAQENKIIQVLRSLTLSIESEKFFWIAKEVDE